MSLKMAFISKIKIAFHLFFIFFIFYLSFPQSSIFVAKRCWIQFPTETLLRNPIIYVQKGVLVSMLGKNRDGFEVGWLN